jgi:hypothetical protein
MFQLGWTHWLIYCEGTMKFTTIVSNVNWATSLEFELIYKSTWIAFDEETCWLITIGFEEATCWFAIIFPFEFPSSIQCRWHLFTLAMLSQILLSLKFKKKKKKLNLKQLKT